MPQTVDDIAAGGNSGKALADSVKAGVSGVSAGLAVAGTAAAIGAAVGASFGPFAPIAAGIGAFLGGAIGFFVGLFKATPSKEEIAKARAAHEAMRTDALNKGWVLAYAGETLVTDLGLDLVGSDNPVKSLNRTLAKPNGAADALRRIAKKHPQYAPLVENLFAGLRWAATQPPETRIAALKSLKTTVDLFKALGSQPGDLQADPFAYMRPPLLDIMRPAFAAAGIDLTDPAVLAKMRANYDFGAAAAARPRPTLGALPIRRRSVGLRSGGRIAVDARAFSPKLAPYGVGSFKLFPDSVPPGESWRAGDDNAGAPLQSPWPYGLDGDRFALPPRIRLAARPAPHATSSGQSTSVPASLGLAGLFGLLWWLL